jgi:hypothetical protein
MSMHAYTEDQLVEQSTIDGTVLGTRGWASFTLSSFTGSDLREQLLGLAAQLGKPWLRGQAATSATR